MIRKITKGLMVGMVGFDLFLHIYQLITKSYCLYFPSWNVYNSFWVAYWGLFLILLLIVFKRWSK